MLAIPVLAGAGSAGMAGLLGKPAGFSNSIRKAPIFYGLVVAGTLGGMALSLAGFDPIKLLVLVAVVNGVGRRTVPSHPHARLERPQHHG